MALFEIRKWNYDENGELSVGEIRALFQPSAQYRISESNCSPGESFASAQREGICYVLKGEVTFRSHRLYREVTIGKGEFVRLPEGTFDIRAGTDEVASFVTVWELPD